MLSEPWDRGDNCDLVYSSTATNNSSNHQFCVVKAMGHGRQLLSCVQFQGNGGEECWKKLKNKGTCVEDGVGGGWRWNNYNSLQNYMMSENCRHTIMFLIEYSKKGNTYHSVHQFQRKITETALQRCQSHGTGETTALKPWDSGLTGTNRRAEWDWNQERVCVYI